MYGVAWLLALERGDGGGGLASASLYLIEFGALGGRGGGGGVQTVVVCETKRLCSEF